MSSCAPKEYLERELPEGWGILPLADAAVHVLGGEWGRPPDEELGNDDVLVRVIRGTEFRNWDTDRDRTAATRVIKSSSLAKRRLVTGDIVIEASGGGPDQPVGRSLLLDGETVEGSQEPLICSNFCRQVRIHEALNPAFVQYWIHFQYLRGTLNQFQSQTTNIRNLRFKEFLASLAVPIPPRREQDRIVEQIGQLMNRISQVRSRLIEVAGMIGLQATRASGGASPLQLQILLKAFSGDLVMTEAELAHRRQDTYESGSELVKRIVSDLANRKRTGGSTTRGKKARRAPKS